MGDQERLATLQADYGSWRNHHDRRAARRARQQHVVAVRPSRENSRIEDRRSRIALSRVKRSWAFFVFDFWRSLHVASRRPEIMKIGERCTVGCPTCGGLHNQAT